MKLLYQTSDNTYIGVGDTEIDAYKNLCSVVGHSSISEQRLHYEAIWYTVPELKGFINNNRDFTNLAASLVMV